MYPISVSLQLLNRNIAGWQNWKMPIDGIDMSTIDKKVNSPFVTCIQDELDIRWYG